MSQVICRFCGEPLERRDAVSLTFETVRPWAHRECRDVAAPDPMASSLSPRQPEEGTDGR